MKQQNVAEKHCDNGQPLRITNQTDRNIKNRDTVSHVCTYCINNILFRLFK